MTQHTENNGSAAFNDLLSGILNTREMRTAIADACPEVLNLWAGDRFTRKLLGNAVARNIQKGLARPGDELRHDELAELFSDPRHLDHLADILPGLLDTAADIALNIGESLAALPPDQREKTLAGILSAVSSGRSGAVITTWARVLANIQAENPDFLARTLEPGISKWINDTDFGELKDLLNAAAGSLGPMTAMAGDLLWQYPAKVVLMASFLPTLANMMLDIANEGLGRFNQMPPDLVTDVMLSYLRDVDGEKIGTIINELTELIRKIHTGSALIGDGGVTGFNRELHDCLTAIVTSVNGETFFKARKTLADGRTTMGSVFADILESHPDLLLDAIRNRHANWNTAIHNTARQTILLADLPEEDVTQAFAENLSQLDAGEASEIANLTSLFINRIRASSPAVLPSVVAQIANGLDLLEIEDTVKGVLDDIGDIVKPLGRAVLPHLVETACRWLMPEDDPSDETAAAAREAIKAFLNTEKEARQ